MIVMSLLKPSRVLISPGIQSDYAQEQQNSIIVMDSHCDE